MNTVKIVAPKRIAAMYRKGISSRVYASNIEDLDKFREWCKVYKPAKVWLLDLDTDKIIDVFTVKTSVEITSVLYSED